MYTGEVLNALSMFFCWPGQNFVTAVLRWLIEFYFIFSRANIIYSRHFRSLINIHVAFRMSFIWIPYQKLPNTVFLNKHEIMERVAYNTAWNCLTYSMKQVGYFKTKVSFKSFLLCWDEKRCLKKDSIREHLRIGSLTFRCGKI